MTASLAIVGCGKQALKYGRALQKDGHTITCLDIDRSAAEGLAEQIGATTAVSLDELLDTQPIGLAICTPVQTHAEWIGVAIDNALGFLCEKPIDQDAGKTAVLAIETARAGTPNVVAMTYRFVPQFQEIRRLIGAQGRDTGWSQTLGQLSIATIRIGGRGSHRLWKHRVDTGGGAHNEMMVHMLDLALWLFGDVDEVELLDWQCLQPTRLIDGQMVEVDAEDWVVVRLKMRSGLVVLIQADLVSPVFGQSLEIQGSQGAFLGSIETERPSFLRLNAESTGFDVGVNHLGSQKRDLPGEIAREFVASCSDRTSSSISPIEDAVRTQILSDQIRISAHSR